MDTAVHATKGEPPAKPKRKRGFFSRLFRFCSWCVLLAIIGGLIARPFLPSAILWYVNRTLNQSPLYQGKIGGIDLSIWRGAYTIRDVRILKTTGNLPVPFFAAKEVDLAVEWRAILHRKIVGQIAVDQPEINFVDDPDEGSTETGSGGPWLKMIRDLFPFDINSARVHNGSVHFRTYQKEKPVDVYLSKLEVNVDDLTNVSKSVTPLLTTVNITALAMDQAKLELHMKLNPFSYDPTFAMKMRLLNLDITTTNDLVEAYGGFRIKRGLFDLVIDLDCNEGQLNGYVKPLFRNMQIFNLIQDIQEDDPLRAFWQAIVGGATALVTNIPRDQLGTVIPFTGDLNAPKVDLLPTLLNVLRNAFIRAYLPKLERQMQQQHTVDLQFGPASLTDPISAGDDD